MRVAETVSKNFRPCCRYGCERIRIRAGGRNTIASVCAEHVARMQLNVGSDPQDFAHEDIELLRVQVRNSGRLSACAVADSYIKVAVIVLAGLRRRIEHQIPDRVIAVVADSQDLASCAFERGVPNVAVRPFDDDGFEVRLYGRRIDGRSDGISIEFWSRGSGHVRLFDMDGIELSVLRVTGIEREANQAGSITRIRNKLRKRFRKAE